MTNFEKIKNISTMSVDEANNLLIELDSQMVIDCKFCDYSDKYQEDCYCKDGCKPSYKH